MRNRSSISVLLFVVLLSLSQSALPASPAKIVPIKPEVVSMLLEKRLTQNFVPGEIVVKFKPSPAGERRMMPSSELKLLNLETMREQTSGGETVYRLPPQMVRSLTANDARDRTLEAVKNLQARPDVEYAQPNYIFQITALPNDPGYALQWHYSDNGSGAGQAPGGINLPTVWNRGNVGSASVVVAVIDTGILPNHEDISGSPNLVSGFDMISDPAIANDGDGRDADATDPGDAVATNECFPGSPAQPSSWHGTHVAGTIGVGRTNNNLGVAGVNWTVKVQPVRVLGKCGGTMVDINDAIRWAAGLPVPGVPANPTPAKVINMSLGGGGSCADSPATQAAINDARGRGVTVVVAAGNDASDAAGFMPASCNGVITVAASDRRGQLVTRYSNFGARVDIMAPGGDVQAHTDGNPDGVLSMVQGGYAFYNGTSMASPHVVGVAALLLAQDGSLTPDQIRDLIKSNALPRTSSQCPKPCGAGLLSANIDLHGATTTVTLSPPSASVEVGKSVAVTATVSRNGAPDAGKTITFTSSNPTIATVSPASATTNANGTAQVTLKGVAVGNVSLQAQSQGVSASGAISVTKSAPVLPLPFLAVALVIGLLLYVWRARQTARR